MRHATFCLSLLLLSCAHGGTVPPSAAPPASTAPPTQEQPPTATAPAAGAGMPCPDGLCAQGLTCLSYYGVAGPRGPRFTSCEVPCAERKCPAGMSCVTIADGPGAVCQKNTP